MQIEIVSVFVGRPEPLGVAELGVVSSIAKRPVTEGRLALSTINLDGDDQSDRTVHGGPDKAVYAYPSEHLAPWAADLDQADLARQHAPFGENVSTRGATESTVCIGDRWTWGDAVLEVCQPRWPCQKLTLHRADARVGAMMRSTGRTGWYLRVVEPGTVEVAGPISVDAHAAGVTVLDAHLAMLDRAVDDPERLGRVLELGALLAEEWSGPLAERLAR
jgi:MOSC domain-containing protein YiiM